MANKFGKFLLFTAAASAAAVGTYYFLKSKEKDSSDLDEDFDDFDDFDDDLEEEEPVTNEETEVTEDFFDETTPSGKDTDSSKEA